MDISTLHTELARVEPLLATWGQALQPWLDKPWVLLLLFAAASALMIWRLHAMESKGFEGTVLGTLIMPYCSGFANVVFALMMGRQAGQGALVVENSLVNNVTNLSLILGLTALLSSASLVPSAQKVASRTLTLSSEQQRINRLELLLTLVAVFFFTGTLWALARDGRLDFYDGLVLVALFVFWQVLHVFEVLKNNVRKQRGFRPSLLIDLALMGVAAWCITLSVERLVGWVESSGSGVFSAGNLGWLSGLVMVLPNAFLALYFARAGRHDIVVSSQVGDGHICIPMCIGIAALMQPISVPAYIDTGVMVIAGAASVHFLAVALLGRWPRWLGALLLLGYAVFVVRGLAG
jgi:cation:H+ antiporter